MSNTLNQLVRKVRACTLCAPRLVHGARPVLQVDARARILIAAQAPGSKVHASGIPFDDPSGERLRDWMGISKETFYDATKIAILPMGFCYPGKGKSGDLPPLAACADTWREPLLAAMPDIKLRLIIGQYAHRWHLDEVQQNLTQTVKAWSSYDTGGIPGVIPLPHPSPRNNIWLKKNPWFEHEVLPSLKQRIQLALDDAG